MNTGKKRRDVTKYDLVFFIIRCFQPLEIPYFLLDISYLETNVHFSNLDSSFSFRSDDPFTRCMICNTMSDASLTFACGCYVRVLIPVKYILYYLYLKYSCPPKCDQCLRLILNPLTASTQKVRSTLIRDYQHMKTFKTLECA